MESPYTHPLEQLAELIEAGEELREAIIKAKEERGNLSATEELAKLAFQDHSRTIGTLGRVLRDGTRLTEFRGEAVLGKLLVKLRDIINGLPTGRRKSELKVGRKREYLKNLVEASERKTLMARLNAFLRLATSISTDLTALEIQWKPRTSLIPAGRNLRGRSEIEEIFAGSKEFVMVCDPYCSHVTLEMLEAVPKGVPVTMLTAKVNDADAFNHKLGEMRSNGRQIEVFLVQGGVRKAPHDRYIVDGKRGYSVGTSLKDIGNRDSTIGHLDNRAEIVQLIESYIDGSKGKTQRL